MIVFDDSKEFNKGNIKVRYMRINNSLYKPVIELSGISEKSEHNFWDYEVVKLNNILKIIKDDDNPNYLLKVIKGAIRIVGTRK